MLVKNVMADFIQDYCSRGQMELNPKYSKDSCSFMANEQSESQWTENH